MKTFPTLYKRTKTGAIQYWKIAATLVNYPMIVKESGQLGTENPIIHREDVLHGKQKRSALQQAEFQAESDWKKKRDEGYKSLADLNITEEQSSDGWVYKVSNKAVLNGNQFPATLSAALDVQLPQFNTDASGNAKPMKAPTKNWKEGSKKNKYPRIAETKLDGLRTFCTAKKQDDGTFRVEFTSSSGKPFVHLNHLVKMVEEGLNGVPEAIVDVLVLDGEIYKHGLELEEINEYAKAYVPGKTEELEFWVYDIPSIPDTQIKRSIAAEKLVRYIHSKHAQSPRAALVTCDEDVVNFHKQATDLGYEGLMLKDPDGTYQFGQRSSFWEKVKMFEDTEFDVVGMTLGQRGTEDLIINCKCDAGTFDVKMTGNRESKQRIWDSRNQYIGKIQLTVKHFGYTKYGIPNLPTGKAFRDE